MKIAELLKSLGEPSRLRIVHLLIQRGPELCVCDITKVLDLPQATVSRHLSPLRHLGIVTTRRDGLWVYYSCPKPENSWQKAVLKSLREAGESDPTLRADLSRFDKLQAKSRLNSSCYNEEDQ